MERRIGGLCLVWLAAWTGGCASTHVASNRTAPTGIAAGESVAVIAWKAPKCEADESTDCATPAPDGDASDFDHCLALAMQAARPDLVVVRLAQLERGPFADSQGFPRTAEALTSALQAAPFQRRLASLSVRYVVVVRGQTTKGPGRLAGSSGSGQQWYMWSIGGERERASSVIAEVVDVPGARQSGAVSAHSRGKEGVQVPVILVLPLPPVPYSAATESLACEALGNPVVDFLLHRDR